MDKTHPEYYRQLQQLSGKLGAELKGPMGAFARLHSSAVAEGTLTTKTKDLISLGIAVCVRCNGCISYHVHDALRAGASRGEILETLGVAILMGGGPSMVYACEALEALDEFEAEGRD